MFQPITVPLLDGEGRTLAVVDDLDAPHGHEFGRVSEVRAFVAEHLGRPAYRATDDCVTVVETVATVRVFEGRREVTEDFLAMVEVAR